MGRFLICVALAVLAGCQLFRSGKDRLPESGMPDLTPTFIDYADTDAFDRQFEAALVSASPAIVVRTENSKPDWEGRLNAWIAAWITGGKSKARTVRGQLGLPRIDGESIREFRLLANDLLDRAEGLALAGGAWYADRRERSRRVALLRPYSLRFHRDGEGLVRLVFFHGDYAAYHPQFLKGLNASESCDSEWSRTVECSQCLRAGKAGVAKLATR